MEVHKSPDKNSFYARCSGHSITRRAVPDGEGRLPVAHLLINRKRITGEQAKKAREKVRKRLKAEEMKSR